MASEIVALQPAAIVDHVALLGDDAIIALVGAAELGGSRRVDSAELRAFLSHVPEFSTKAGGSAANVARSLAGAFGVAAGVVGACGGEEEWGELFLNSLKRAGVATDRVRRLPGPTGRAVILTSRSSGQRTMRTNLVSARALSPDMLEDKDFQASQWLFVSAYTLYQPGLLRAAAQKAKVLGTRVMLDLASWEIVEAYAEELQGVLKDGLISCCIGNEDEAKELVGRPDDWTPEITIEYLLQYCSYAVVTMGAKGCTAGCRADSIVRVGSASGLLARTVSLSESTLSADGTPLDGALVLRQAAVAGVDVVDTTGAGDAFSSGFLYGLLRGLPLEKCASIGCMAGAAAVQTIGADMGPPEWQWLHQRLHSGLAAAVIDNTPQEIFKELLDAYALISRIGVGVVYFGSARLNRGSQYYQPVIELARDVALFLGCPTWTGGGPGMMRAASEGAMEAGLPVGAVKISREAGQETVLTADYLPPGASVVCKHMPTRKAALTDAGVRRELDQRTAYVFLPGGLGTMDELFAILTLIQLNKLDTQHPVPMVVVNYGGFFDGLLQMLSAFDESGVMKKAELDGLYVAKCNADVLHYLGKFYGLDATSMLSNNIAA